MRRLALLGAGVLVVAGLLFALHRDLPGWYAQAMPAWYARTVYPLEHKDLIRQSARRNDLDPAMVVAVIYAESGFDEQAVSESGALGLMQLLPSTATELAARAGDRFDVDDLHDPRVNIRYGTQYLAYLLDRYDGSQVEALAAYHAGPRNVDRWISGVGGEGLGEADIPFADTSEYAREVGALADLYRRVYGKELESSP